MSTHPEFWLSVFHIFYPIDVRDDKTPIVCRFVSFHRIQTSYISLERGGQGQLNDVWIIVLAHSYHELLIFQKSILFVREPLT